MPAATPKNLRVFGVGAGLILGFFGFLAWRKASPNVPYFAGFGTAFCVLGLAAPGLLRPVYQAWMRVASVIAAVNTFLILTVVYYAMITPYALILRLQGHDPLDREWKTGDSYWHPREARGPEAYEKTF